MENQNMDVGSDGREYYELKISELLKALAERKSPCIYQRHISSTLSILKNTGTGTSHTSGTFRSRAILPENISQLSKSQFKRRDPLRESQPASGPVPDPSIAGSSSQEGQLQLSRPQSSNPVLLALLVEKSKSLPSSSLSSVVEKLKEREVQPHILGVQAWTKQQPCGPLRALPELAPPIGNTYNTWSMTSIGFRRQIGPTNQWFFEDLKDLQRKLFLGASKKSGVQRNSQTAQKAPRHD